MQSLTDNIFQPMLRHGPITPQKIPSRQHFPPPQLWVLQGRFSDPDPGQLPPFDCGVIFVRERDCCPPPQFFEQPPH